MANIKELKVKIKSTKSTLKITTAMKLVSAAKLAKAQATIQQARPYASELNDSIKTMAALTKNYSHSYLKEDKENNFSALLVISSNKGLCGGYNAQLIKQVRSFLNEKKDENIKVFFLGKKAKEVLRSEVVLGEYYEIEGVEPSFDDIRNIGGKLSDLFCSGELGKVYVAYNLFRSAISFDSKVEQVLPMSFSAQEKEKLEKDFPFDFKYDPSPKEILDSLIPEVYTTTLYTFLLDALASEHGSRMAAMDNATSNCKDVIKSLTLYMNKLRQAAVTTELIEVVSGAESLKG